MKSDSWSRNERANHIAIIGTIKGSVSRNVHGFKARLNISLGTGRVRMGHIPQENTMRRIVLYRRTKVMLTIFLIVVYWVWMGDIPEGNYRKRTVWNGITKVILVIFLVIEFWARMGDIPQGDNQRRIALYEITYNFGSLWGLHVPGLSDMCQQDLAILPMGQLVPVDGIFTPGAQVKAEVVVHVKHVHFVEVCHSRAVEISLYDIPAQVVLCVLWHFRRFESYRHGHVPYHQTFGAQNLGEPIEEAVQVFFVDFQWLVVIPDKVPDTRAYDDDIGLGSFFEVSQHTLHVCRICPSQEVEPHEVVASTVLTHFPVGYSIVHFAERPSFHQSVIGKGFLPLISELALC